MSKAKGNQPVASNGNVVWGAKIKIPKRGDRKKRGK